MLLSCFLKYPSKPSYPHLVQVTITHEYEPILYVMKNVEETLEITDNDFLRQFEAKVGDCLIKLEYAQHPRKLFLTKFVIDEDLCKRGYDSKFLEAIFNKFLEEEKRVLPTCSEVVKFYKSHRNKYKCLLPTGINL